MDIAHLDTFLTVYRTRNLTRAAEQLHLSQPSVSAHLSALETELSRPLFVRLHRGVEPTSDAHALADRIGDHLDALRSVTTLAVTDALTETVRIGGPADALAEVVLPTLAPLVQRGLRVQVRTGLTRPLIDALADGELDMVVATTPARHRNVTIQPLFTEVLMLVAGPGVRIDSGSITATNGAILESLPLIGFGDPAPLVRRYWREQFERPSPRPGVVFDDLRAIARAVESGAGWSVLPDYLVAESISTRRLTLLHKPADPPHNDLYLATTSARRRPTHLDAVVQQLHTTIRVDLRK
jgi:DNA-binding transcriptional LysR family regulator